MKLVPILIVSFRLERGGQFESGFQVGGNSVNGACEATLWVGGLAVSYYTTNAYNGTLQATVPVGSTYGVTATSTWYFNFGNPYGWRELS